MEYLEKTQGWKEEEFDMVLQFMRTVLLRRRSPLPSRDEGKLTRPCRWCIPHLHHAFRSVTTA